MFIKNINLLIFLLGAVLGLLALLADVSSLSTSGFGFLQESMLVISGIISAFGLRRFVIPEKNKWDWLLVVIYLSGLLFAGLQPNPELILDYNVFLDFKRFNLQDFYVNIIGFAPFGFLLMAALSISIKASRAVILTIILAALVSTLIEYLQYCCIPGRYSSGYDLLSNVAAVVLGVIIYLGYAHILSVPESKTD